MKHAIDAVTDLELTFERFDMNVRRTLLDSALQNQVDQANDRRFGRQVLEVLDVLQRAAFVVEVLDQRAHRRAALAVITFDQGFHFVAWTDGHLYRHFTGIGNCFKRIQHAGVGAQHLHPVLAPADRHHLILAHESFSQRWQRIQHRRQRFGH